MKGAIPILAGQSQNREFLNYDIMKEEKKIILQWRLQNLCRKPHLPTHQEKGTGSGCENCHISKTNTTRK
jgi:hypothetical protein